MAREPLRLGLIGLGPHMLENLWPALRVLPGNQVVVVCSRDGGKAVELARERGAAGATANWQAMLDDDQLDAVVVAATPDLHESVLARCFERALPVYVEKPPARDAERLAALVQLEQQTPSVRAFVGYNFRFGEGYQLLRRALDASPVAGLRLRFVSSKPRAPWLGYATPEQSYLYGVAIHAFELVIDALGPPTRLDARWTPLAPDRFALDVAMVCDAGRFATLALGNYGRQFEFDVECICEGGSHGTLVDQTSLGIVVDPAPGPPALGGKQRVALDLPSSRGGYHRAGYAGALGAFLDGVRAGQASRSPLAASVPVYDALDRTLLALKPVCDATPAS